MSSVMRKGEGMGVESGGRRGTAGKRMVGGGEVKGEGEGREGHMWQDVCGGQGGMAGGLYVAGETGCMRRRSRAGCGRDEHW